MRGQLAELAGAVFDVLFPRICSICGSLLASGDDTICISCRSSFEEVGRVVCPQCGRPATRAPARGTRGVSRCPSCPKPPVHFASARAAFQYRNDMAEAVQAFKYNRRYELGLMLARAMYMALERNYPDSPRPDILIPVPMHFARRLRRGYNHASILTEEYGRLAGIEWSDETLARIRHTPKQSLLPAEERAGNVLGAFDLAYPERVRGRSIGLVDDVLTSGHTVNECARVLMAEGAASVHVLALARA